MKMVIDLPEDIYKKYMDDYTKTVDVLHAVRHGTPLPEHHGRLIDVDDLYENTEICHSDIDGYACVRWKDINNAPTIIEADKGRSR